jgi:hypothetical protein
MPLVTPSNSASFFACHPPREAKAIILKIIPLPTNTTKPPIKTGKALLMKGGFSLACKYNLMYLIDPGFAQFYFAR